MTRALALLVAFSFLMAGNAQAAELRIVGPGGAALTGAAVSNAGDFNGDGVEDVVVGSYLEGSPDREFAGSAHVVFGKRGSGTRTVDLARLGDQGVAIRGSTGWAYTGLSVGGGEDFNGDGLDDVIVGAPRDGPGGLAFGGSAHVVFGSRTPGAVELGRLGTRGLRLDGASANAFAGLSVALVPDMNGDGRAEAIVGEGGRGAVFEDSATAWVVFGRPGGGTAALSDLAGGGFPIVDHVWGPGAASVGSAGDVNGDGRGDVVIGVPWMPRPGDPQAFVVFGKGDGDAVPLYAIGDDGFSIGTVSTSDRLGAAVAGVGDLNGDGLDDVAVGAPQADPLGRADAGAVHVVFGTRTPRAVSAESLGDAGFTIAGARGRDGFLRGGDELGWSLAAGGRGRALVGSPYGAGVWEVEGAAAGTTVDLAHAQGRGVTRLVSGRSSDESGRSIAGADVDGDGGRDVLVGAWLASGNRGEVRTPGVHRRASSNAASLVPLGQDAAGFSTDGGRYAVRTVSDGSLSIFDTRTDRVRRISIPSGCEGTATGSGYAALSCDGYRGMVRDGYVVSLRTGALRPIDVALPSTSVTGYGSVGRHWVTARLDCYHCTFAWVNWRTGEVRPGPSDFDPDDCRNLDDPRLGPSECLDSNGRHTRDGAYRLTGGFQAPLLLSHGRAQVVLDSCSKGCGSPDVRDGRATWISGGEIRTYTIRTRTRGRVRVPRFWESQSTWPVAVELIRLGDHLLVRTDAGLLGGDGQAPRWYRLR